MASRLRWRLPPSVTPTRGRAAKSVHQTAEITPLPGVDGDRLGYDAWVLPPLPVSRSERWIRLGSVFIGPLLLVLVAGLLISALMPMA
jgi:hypothetical protein